MFAAPARPKESLETPGARIVGTIRLVTPKADCGRVNGWAQPLASEKVMQLPQVRSKRKPGHWRGGIFIPHTGIAVYRDQFTDEQAQQILDDSDLEFRQFEDEPWRSLAQIKADDLASHQASKNGQLESQEPSDPPVGAEAPASAAEADPAAAAAPATAAAPVAAAAAPTAPTAPTAAAKAAPKKGKAK